MTSAPRPQADPELDDDWLVAGVLWAGAGLRLVQAWVRAEAWGVGSVVALIVVSLTSVALAQDLRQRLARRARRH